MRAAALSLPQGASTHRTGSHLPASRRPFGCVRASCGESRELQVCTNKTCRRQGSQQIVRFARDLQLPNLEVVESGCLGKCGAGPNISLTPPGVVLGHVATPVVLSKMLSTVCDVTVDDVILQATQLRSMGNSAAINGDLEEAISLWDKAIALHPAHGLYAIYSNRSAAMLTLGRAEEALEDAEETLRLAPPDFITAHVRKVDALYALKRFPKALRALEDCGADHPEYTKTKEYKDMKAAIDKAMKTTYI